MNETGLSRYMALFRGNPRSFGQWDPKQKDPNKSSLTKKVPYDAEVYRRHLNGETGLGLVPILDDSTCYWGAIDIDNHGKKEDSDIKGIEARVLELGLPLVSCRSKSGGVHLFLFGREPLRAAQVHSMLKKWAKDLGVEGVDCIFPKQSKLAYSDGGERQLGNWINLPYFKSDDTVRYAVENGHPLPFELFLTLAESKAVTAFDLDTLHGNEHSEAPPCLQTGMANKVSSGSRNEFAYNMTIYMKKRFPEDYRDRMYDLNGQMFEDPMPFNEIKKVVSSAGRREYRYKCGTEPCKSMCDRKLCLTKKFGITQEDSDAIDAEAQLPEFTDLIKHTTNPVRWELIVSGKIIMMSSEELQDWRSVKTRCMESLNRVLPMIKNEKWLKILGPLVENCRVVQAPEDASAEGAMKIQLIEFIRKIDLNDPGTDIKKRSDLYRGIPVVQESDTGRHVYFRGQDFVSFLKRQKCEDLKGPNLWFALKKVGVKHGRFRADDKTPAVWSIKISDEHKLELFTPDFTPEI